MGWGTLREGQSYEFALLRVDIAGNSELGAPIPRSVIAAVYGALRDLVTRIVEKRDGRIWSWEGDGGLAAFYFMDKTIQATLCGMEIVHELLLQNLLFPALPEPLRVKLAVHAGPCRFLASAKESGGDTVRRVEMLESAYTAPGSLTVSPGVFTDLGSKLSPLFIAVPGPDNGSVYSYSLEWEKKMRVLVFSKAPAALSRVLSARARKEMNLEALSLSALHQSLPSPAEEVLVYVDVHGLSDKERGKALAEIAKNPQVFFGVLDPAGTVKDIAALFHAGAVDYIGKKLTLAAFTAKRAAAVAEYARET